MVVTVITSTQDANHKYDSFCVFSVVNTERYAVMLMGTLSMWMFHNILCVCVCMCVCVCVMRVSITKFVLLKLKIYSIKHFHWSYSIRSIKGATEIDREYRKSRARGRKPKVNVSGNENGWIIRGCRAFKTSPITTATPTASASQSQSISQGIEILLEKFPRMSTRTNSGKQNIKCANNCVFAPHGTTLSGIEFKSWWFIICHKHCDKTVVLPHFVHCHMVCLMPCTQGNRSTLQRWHLWHRIDFFHNAACCVPHLIY